MRDFSPIINRLRTGSAIDPYVEKVEYLTVKNSILFLAELPSKFDGVIISGYSEVSEDTLQTIGLLDVDQYVVDYKNGSIYFNASENDKQVTVAYKGRGIAMTPADRIYYSEGGVIQSLQDIIEEAVDKTTEASSAIAYAKAQGDYAKAQGTLANDKATLADQKATLANTAASNADTKGAYAKDQGDFAKAQGENAQAKASEAVTATNQAIAAKNDAVTATTNANQATQSANDKATFAETQGNYAKQEGDATKQATSEFQTVKASVLQAKSDTEEATQIALDSAENADTKAALADTKATLANDKANLADQKATLAQEKADLANASATNADAKASLADTKATLADEKATLAQTKAEYAQTQGEYAKSQGDIARNESSNLSILKTDVTNATTLANSKAQEADTQAQYAKTQGDYAKEQGDLAREALEAGGVSTVNGKSGVVTLTPTDIGTMSTADINAAVNFAKSEAETYADEKISEVIGSAPETLDTLNELAQALGDDPNFATTVSNQIGLKADQLDFDLHKNDGSIHPTPAKQAEWDNKIPKTEKGAPSGVATLDPNGKVPSTQLPPIASSWDTLTGKPSLFPSTAHTHSVSDVVGLQDALSNAVKMASYPYLITATANQSSFVVPVETFDKVNDLLVVVINGRHLAIDDYSIVDKTVTFTEQLSAGDSIYGYVLKNVPKSIAEGYNGANLADGTVAKSKLSSEVVASLNKADSALQSVPVASDTVSGTVVLDDTANSSSTTKAATANSVKGVSDRVTANADQIGILLDKTDDLKTAKTNKDANGIYTTVTYRRKADNSLYATSVLSGGTSPSYTTRTITYYESNGTTVRKTVTFTLSYDTDGVLISEV